MMDVETILKALECCIDDKCERKMRMNKKILYRGKRVDNNKWVYGSYFEGMRLPLIVTMLKETGVENTYNGVAYPIIPETLGQYIGMSDMNELPIYQGDIVKCWGGLCIRGNYEYDDTITIADDFHIQKLDLVEYDKLGILGNIHDKSMLRNGD